jgi:hypothetical protein
MGLGRRRRQLLETFEEATAHVRAGFCATGARVIARLLVRAGGHGGHIGLRRRQRDARRNGDERDRHGEEAKGDTTAMKHCLHVDRLPYPLVDDKKLPSACLLTGSCWYQIQALQ